MDDYLTFIMIAVCVVIGAGLFRVGLMHPKSESREDTRRWLFIVLGVAFGVAAVLILVLRVMKLPS
jgi:threonine/homoserine/homoserine lactone efflux protein